MSDQSQQFIPTAQPVQIKQPTRFLYVKNLGAKIKINRIQEAVAKFILRDRSSLRIQDAVFQNPELIKKCWIWDEYPPSQWYIMSRIRNSKIKWYLKNTISFEYETGEEKEWNADFINGLTNCGQVRFSIRNFPCFYWKKCEFLKDILLSSPFGGYLGYSPVNKTSSWIKAAIFYLPYSKKSFSYIAGILATGEREEINGKTYARYPPNQMETFRQLGIPIEGKPRYKNFYISPIWISLFLKYMPSIIRRRWDNMDKPYRANEYAPVLWYTYIGTNFRRCGIPYLKCRRRIFYEFKSKDGDGPIAQFKKMWVDMNLYNLDNRIKDRVIEFAKESVIIVS